jgi:O-antigen/teichoic acid export membrane protein
VGDNATTADYSESALIEPPSTEPEVSAVANPGDGIESQVVSGARWVVLLRVGTMATLWITSIALARLLVPSQYGLAGMAMIVVSVLTVFQESGLHAALIQRRDRIQEAVDAATAYAPFAGVFLMAMTFAAAPLAGLFFRHHEVTQLVRALSVVFLLRSISQVPIALVQKEFRFRSFALVMLTGSLLQMSVAIGLAAEGAGAWSAIGGLIALEAWCALLMWRICPMRAHPRRASLTELRGLLRYGRNMVGANINIMLFSYVDLAVVGRFLGAPALGAYTIGYQSGKQAVANVTYASNQLIFPAYSKLQDDLERFRRAYLRSIRFITTLSVPVSFGLVVVSSEFIRVVYGERWTAAVPVVAIMSLMGLVLSVTATMGEVLKATNRPGLFFRISLLETVLAVASILVFYRFGIAAVAACVASAVTITGGVVTWQISRILGLRRADWIGVLRSPILAGLVLVGGILLTKVGIAALTKTATAPVLLLLVVEGAVLYLGSLRLIEANRLREFLREIEKLTALGPLLRALRFGAGDASTTG